MKKILSAIALFLAFTNYGYAQGTKRYSATPTPCQKRYERAEYNNVIEVTSRILIRHINIGGKWIWQINELSNSVFEMREDQKRKIFTGQDGWRILINKDFANLFSRNGIYVLQEILKLIITNDSKKIESLASHVVQQGHFGGLPPYIKLGKSVFFLNGDLKGKYNDLISWCEVHDLGHSREANELRKHYKKRIFDGLRNYKKMVQKYLEDEFKHLDKQFEKCSLYQEWPPGDKIYFIFTFNTKKNTLIGRCSDGGYWHDSYTMKIVISINKEGEMILHSIYP